MSLKSDDITAAMIHLGNASEMSHGTAKVSFLLDVISVKFAAHTLDKESASLLIGVDELNHWGIYWSNISDRLIYCKTGQFAFSYKVVSIRSYYGTSLPSATTRYLS